jgi:hypothetical protein
VRRRAAALWPLVLVACAREAPPPAQEAASDSALVTPAPPPLTFDPGAVQPGDTIGGLVVVSKDVERSGPDSLWIGSVVFEGDLVVQGVYQQHPDWPTVQAPCFQVTDPGSAAHVPRFASDALGEADPRTWFCFSNPDVALDLLGSPDEPHEAVIALSRYEVRRDVADVHDMAEIAELMQMGPASNRTLMDPS